MNVGELLERFRGIRLDYIEIYEGEDDTNPFVWSRELRQWNYTPVPFSAEVKYWELRKDEDGLILVIEI